MVERGYKVTPLNDVFGAIISGLDLSKPEKISEAVREQLKIDIFKYRLLLFKNNGKIVPPVA